MSDYQGLIFTDSIKDVIGNDPIIDQFDNSYAAGFYGTMPDDFITGSMLFKLSTKGYLFSITGDRGRAFSQMYSRDEPVLGTSTVEVNKNPFLSYRVKPWYEKTTNMHRSTTFFDAYERIYDTCLPNLKQCFSANGAGLWASSNDSSLWLSPYKNVDSENIGYIRFNDIETPGVLYQKDPTVDNNWTWSFPYEERYNPDQRETGNVFSSLLENVSCVATTISGSPFITQINPFNNSKKVNNFLPLFIGHIKKQDINTLLFRNSFRRSLVLSGNISFNPGDPNNGSSILDDSLGFSYLIPSDVNFSKLVNHDYLLSYTDIGIPNPEPLTGSTSYEDTIKTLFGFGDLNTMWYSNWNIDLNLGTSCYYEGFESNSDGDDPSLVSGFWGSFLQVNWENASSNTDYPWRILKKSGTSGGINYISSSNKISWRSTLNDMIAVSQTDPYFLGSMGTATPPNFLSSTMTVDITSSYPWSIQYDRAINAAKSNVFLTYFSSTPEKDLTAECIDFIYGNDGNTDVRMSNYDFLNLDDSYDPVPEDLYLEPFSKAVDIRERKAPFSPGRYRLKFAYLKSGSNPSLHPPDISAVDNIEIICFKENAFSPDTNSQKIGGNNYPKFKEKLVDYRYNPIATGNEYAVTGSQNFYRGCAFGISPEIRGWKYGLYSGLPQHTKTIFRRNKFGQVRDMLEQRLFTKSIKEGNSPVDNESIIKFSGPTKSFLPNSTDPGPVSVKFVKTSYEIDSKNIGRIKTTPVDPESTSSQNLSTEVTSSLPYFDGMSRLR